MADHPDVIPAPSLQLPPRPRITVAEIAARVCHEFGVTASDMASSCRARPIARPRQVAMYLSRQLTPMSLPEIGRHFGNRDHTTVMHAIRKIAELILTDQAFALRVAAVRWFVEAAAGANAFAFFFVPGGMAWLVVSPAA